MMSATAFYRRNVERWWVGLISTLPPKNGILLLLGRVIQMVNGFALSVLLVRVFGLSKVGTYTVAAVAIAVLSLLCSAGLQYSLPRAPLSNEQRNTLALVLGLCLIPVVFAATAVFGFVMAKHSGEWIEIALFASGGYFFGQMNLLNMLLLMQDRVQWTIMPSLINSLGLVIAALVATSVIQLASILLLSRATGNLAVFCGMRYARVPARSAYRYGLEGFKYSPMDLIALMSEQTGALFLAYLLPRSELGIYGLCQQLVMAADTPGWSLVQSYYPELVRTRLEIGGMVRTRLLKLSVLMGVAVTIAAAVLGTYVYRLPLFWIMVGVVAVSLPARYLNNFYDQILRAAGHVRAGTVLAAVKFRPRAATLRLVGLDGWAVGIYRGADVSFGDFRFPVRAQSLSLVGKELSMEPLLSVIVPAFNIEAYIAEAIRSIQKQSLEALEIIVIDDNSTDGTADAVRAFEGDKRLRFLENSLDARGPSGSRNTGLRIARGKYIGFLDGDDLWHPEKARRHIEVLGRQPEIDLTFSRWGAPWTSTAETPAGSRACRESMSSRLKTF